MTSIRVAAAFTATTSGVNTVNASQIWWLVVLFFFFFIAIALNVIQISK